jgi:hypothetical protein
MANIFPGIEDVEPIVVLLCKQQFVILFRMAQKTFHLLPIADDSSIALTLWQTESSFHVSM